MTTMASALKLVRAGRHEEALAALAHLACDPAQQRAARGHRAWLLKSLGRHEEALSDAEWMAADAPDDLDGLTLRAELLRATARADDAARAAIDILARDPMHTGALRVLAAAQESRARDPAPPTGEARDAGRTASLNDVLAQLDAVDESQPTSVWREIGRLLYTVTRALRPALVVETGTFIGYSALCLAQALEDGAHGHLHCFDLFLDRPGYVSPVLGPTPNGLDAARGHIERAGLAHRVTFHRGDSSSNILRELADRGPCVDLAFIDGDHELKGALLDWRAVDRVLVEGGIVLLHDTMPSACGWLGPRALLEELGERARFDYPWVNLATADGSGLALIQKRTRGASPVWKPRLMDLVTERLFTHKHWGGRS